MVHLSQLLRKDNFLTIEAIEEIIGDKFDGFNYVFFLSPPFWFMKKINKTKEKKRSNRLGSSYDEACQPESQ